MRTYKNKLKIFLKIFSISLVSIIIAGLFRKFLLSSLENQVVWITFYPAVMAASIFGGFFSGFFSSLLTIILVVYDWRFFTDKPFLSDDKISMINIFVFLVNCCLMSAISEYSIQQRKKSEEHRLKAESANRTKSAFLANMSHEIRTPLNAILGFSQVLLRSPLISYEDKTQIKIINDSGNHLLTIINDILDISKVESGQIKVQNEKFNLFALLEDIKNLFFNKANEKNLIFNVNYNNITPKYIVSDIQKIRQILVNLLGNAFKFTDNGTVSLSLFTEKYENSPYSITFKVQDTGIGIKEEEIVKIFDNFYQASNSRAGTGLGLSISKKMVEMLDSKIYVKSRVNEGTAFTFTLNVDGFVKDDEDISGKEKTFIYKNNSDRRVKTLIVDDIAENITLLSALLKNIKADVYTASTAEEGINKFEHMDFDIIFMDILLPDLSGNEVIKEIRRNTRRNRPIVVGVSASIFKEEIQGVLDAGADDFLPKPIKVDALYILLNKYLDLNLVKEEVNFSSKLPNISVNLEKIIMPHELKAKFYEAIEQGDFIWIGDLIEEIDDEYLDIKNKLKEYLDNFDYIKIKELLEKIKDNSII